jgi:hypothetical protein
MRNARVMTWINPDQIIAWRSPGGGQTQSIVNEVNNYEKAHNNISPYFNGIGPYFDFNV